MTGMIWPACEPRFQVLLLYVGILLLIPRYLMGYPIHSVKGAHRMTRGLADYNKKHLLFFH